MLYCAVLRRAVLSCCCTLWILRLRCSVLPWATLRPTALRNTRFHFAPLRLATLRCCSNLLVTYLLALMRMRQPINLKWHAWMNTIRRRLTVASPHAASEGGRPPPPGGAGATPNIGSSSSQYLRPVWSPWSPAAMFDEPTPGEEDPINLILINKE